LNRIKDTSASDLRTLTAGAAFGEDILQFTSTDNRRFKTVAEDGDQLDTLLSLPQFP
jgi:hypothetical protein